MSGNLFTLRDRITISQSFLPPPLKSLALKICPPLHFNDFLALKFLPPSYLHRPPAVNNDRSLTSQNHQKSRMPIGRIGIFPLSTLSHFRQDNSRPPRWLMVHPLKNLKLTEYQQITPENETNLSQFDIIKSSTWFSSSARSQLNITTMNTSTVHLQH